MIVGDPFAPILEQEASGLLAPLGLTANFERAGYDAIREIILAEKSLPSESFDIVAFDVVWTSEFAKRGALISIDGFYRDDPQGIRLDQFLEPALDGIRADGALYGLPIQPHAELLWYRTDL
ncbi:MAG: extracellular solute-binding protein, partial [Planctomycetota bacterium]